jgi:hypothetical protein
VKNRLCRPAYWRVAAVKLSPDFDTTEIWIIPSGLGVITTISNRKERKRKLSMLHKRKGVHSSAEVTHMNNCFINGMLSALLMFRAGSGSFWKRAATKKKKKGKKNSFSL